MKVKGYKLLPFFWVYAAAIAMFILGFAVTHALVNLVLEAVFVYIMAKYPSMFFQKVVKREQ